jgi:leucine-zipper-like transcriptional regulator 1
VSESLDTTVGRRLLYGATVHNNKLFVLGGQTALTHESYLSDVWVSDNGVNWSQIANDKEFLGKNISGAVASFNGKLWVIGGGKYEHPDISERWTNHVYSSEDGINWVREKDAPWSGRQYHDLCVWDNKLWVVGGNNGENLSDIWYMKTDGEWVNVETPAEFEPRHATALAEYNNQLVIVCGNYHNDCWVVERVY